MGSPPLDARDDLDLDSGLSRRSRTRRFAASRTAGGHGPNGSTVDVGDLLHAAQRLHAAGDGVRLQALHVATAGSEAHHLLLARSPRSGPRRSPEPRRGGCCSCRRRWRRASASRRPWGRGYRRPRLRQRPQLSRPVNTPLRNEPMRANAASADSSASCGEEEVGTHGFVEVARRDGKGLLAGRPRHDVLHPDPGEAVTLEPGRRTLRVQTQAVLDGLGPPVGEEHAHREVADGVVKAGVRAALLVGDELGARAVDHALLEVVGRQAAAPQAGPPAVRLTVLPGPSRALERSSSCTPEAIEVGGHRVHQRLEWHVPASAGRRGC